jgi:hypothetical protein
MDVKTKPQYWFQIEPKSTEELTRLWEQREVDPAPEAELALVEQVLIERHVLEPAQPDVEAEPAPLEVFTVRELGVSRRSAEWEVRLTPELAQFIGPRGRGRFMISRDRSRSEFQFRHAGLLMLSESAVARVRGKIFDFGPHKASLAAWLPPIPSLFLQREARLTGTGLLLLGALSFFHPALASPILGGLLVVLGLINLLAPRRATFFVNGLLLLTAGAVTLVGLLFTIKTFMAAEFVLPIFWILFGLLELFWGYQAFANFRKFSRI